MTRVLKHSRELDWCHLCGKKTRDSADICYPVNAKHDLIYGEKMEKEGQYIRICLDCVTHLKTFLQSPKALETEL